MSSNETLIQVPSELGDTLVLKKFLTRLIEKLDLVLGYRGQDPYLAQSDLTTPETFLSSLPAKIDTLSATVEENTTDISELENDVEELRNNQQAFQTDLYKTKLLAAAYYDFNFAGYATLGGLYEFTALGSAIINPPAGEGLVPATTYIVMISSYTTIGGGAVQEVYITSATTKTFHKRAGSTSALLFSLGWF